MKKGIISLTLLILVILTIGTVSAEDNLTEITNLETASDIVNTPNMEIENNTETNQEPTNIGTFEELNTEIVKCENKGILYLDKDYKFVSKGIDTIQKEITIDGQNHILDANNMWTIFSISSPNVVLKNINFINANGWTGSAIYCEGNNCSLINCNFTNNYCRDNGIIILIEGKHNFINCTFKNNYNGGVIEQWRSSSKLTNCNFYNNTGTTLKLSSGNTLTSCNFINNTGKNGGTIYSQGQNTLNNCNFINNTAENGGAIYIEGQNTLNNCNFIDNQAEFYGGAIYSGIRNNVFSNCNFTNNLATISDHIHNINSATLINCTLNPTHKFGEDFTELSNLIENTSENGVLNLIKDYKHDIGLKTGIAITKSITIDGQGHTINGNNQSRIFYMTDGNITLKNINFVNTNALNLAAIYCDNKICNIINCTFTDGLGTQIKINEGENVKISDCTFINNNGTAISSSHFSNIENCNFKNNARAIFIENGRYNNIINCNFSNNYNDKGGAIYTFGDDTVIKNCSFSNNYAQEGGAINLYYGNDMLIINCSFDNNKAESGGAISFGHYSIKNTSIINCTFYNNTASDKGGAIECYQSDTKITNSNFTYNYAPIESNIFWDGNEGTMINCTIINIKKPSEYGENFTEIFDIIENTNFKNIILDKDYQYDTGLNSGIIITRSITIDGQGHTINGNKQSRIFHVKSKDVILKNIHFVNANDSAIHYEYGYNLKLINCSFTNNYGENGGAINAVQQITLINCTFINNHAANGGALNSYGGVIENCYFKNNTAYTGGAINIEDESTINNCIFIENHAYANGGAISGLGLRLSKGLDILNSIFDKNTAENGGALIWEEVGYTECGSLYINNCNFTNNNANNIGGAMVGEGFSVLHNCNFINNTNKNSTEIIDWHHEGGYSGGYTIYNCLFENNTGLDIDTRKVSITINNESYQYSNDWHDASIYIISPKEITGTLEICTNEHVYLFGEDKWELEGDKKVFYLFLNDLEIGRHYVEINYYVPYGPISKTGYTNICKDNTTLVGLKNINTYYNDNAKYSIQVYGPNGKLVDSGETIYFKIGSNSYYATTNQNGIATFNIPKLTPKTYTITASYKNFKISKKITVKQVLTINSVKVKKSAKKLVLQATLKKGKTPIKSKQITFKFNGKTYKGKTNSKGIAKVTIKSTVLKKLKVGKKVTYQATYIKDTVKKTVKIQK